MAAKILGRYIVADSAICHGKPTFRGTRVLVSDVLDQIAEGLAWETILCDWHGLNREALAEAVQLASRALPDHKDETTQSPNAMPARF